MCNIFTLTVIDIFILQQVLAWASNPLKHKQTNYQSSKTSGRKLLESSMTTFEHNCTDDAANASESLFCNVTFDYVLCWSSATPGEIVKQPCPEIFGSGPDTFVYRTCLSDGHWKKLEKWKGFGYSDYSECLTHITPMINAVFDVKEETTATNIISYNNWHEQLIFTVLNVLSLICLVGAVSMLHCKRFTKIGDVIKCNIYRHLLCACLLESSCRMLYNSGHMLLSTSTLTCRPTIAVSMYAEVASFTWLLLLVNLQYITTSSKHLCSSGYMLYCILGWGFPILPTSVWTVSLWLTHEHGCWVNFKGQPTIWILDTPKCFFLIISCIFLTMSFWHLIRKSEAFKRTCYFKRLFTETICYCLYFLFVIAFSVADGLIFFYWQCGNVDNHVNAISNFLHVTRGIVICLILCIMWYIITTDVQKVIETKIRHISHQELVPTEETNEQDREFTEHS